MKIPDTNGIVIDGFPRDIGQALSFEDQVRFKKSVGPIYTYCHMILPTETHIAHSVEHGIMSFVS